MTLTLTHTARSTDTADRYSTWSTDFPLVEGGTGNVQQGHADYCSNWGHATYTRDGAVQSYCPRCGDTLTATTEPTTEPTAVLDPHRASVSASVAIGEYIDTLDIATTEQYSRIRRTCSHLVNELVSSVRATEHATALAYARMAGKSGDLLSAQCHCAGMNYFEHDALVDLIYAAADAAAAAYAAVGE